MTQKLRFSIDNAELISENPDSNFAIMSVDFFASGKNLHEMWVSDETLFRTAESIKNCPLVWVYDKTLDDIGTHDSMESPVGFVPEYSEIKSRQLEDGRTMLSVIAFVWKKYTGDILKFFKRDKGVKPVSVEMSVYASKERDDGLVELLDFRYDAITILGSYVTPAIPLAKSTVLSFSKQYDKIYKEEFSSKIYDGIDFTIPEGVKTSVTKAFSTYSSLGANPVVLSVARHLSNNSVATPEKIKYIVKTFQNSNPDRDSNKELSFALMGGKETLDWASSIYEKMKLADNKYSVFSERGVNMPYSSLADINPALKGIEPSISLGQANEIAKQADSIGSDEDKNGWAIAISNFKKTHKVEDGKWVKKETMSQDDGKKENLSMEDSENKNIDVEEIENAATPPEGTKAEEEGEPTAEENKEKEEGKGDSEDKKKVEMSEADKKFAGMVAEMATMFAADDDDDDNVRMAAEEMKKGEFAHAGTVAMGLYAKMCKMAQKMEKMSADAETYMAENAELKKFKADSEEKEKSFAVESTLKELSSKVVIPADDLEAMRKNADNYSFARLDEWKTACKAQSFEFAVRTNDSDLNITRMQMPFASGNDSPKKDLWAD